MGKVSGVMSSGITKSLRILIACEFSGIVRDAFITRGHQAISCDLLDSERPGPHIQASIFDVLYDEWDLMIAFPPCTHLARSGARWWSGTKEQEMALEFVEKLLYAPIPRIALENPIGAINSQIYKPDQIIQPWMFGHPETKSTCLWLKNLPKLTSTKIADPPYSNRVWYEPPSANRWKNRSRTLPGIADAMAEQWG